VVAIYHENSGEPRETTRPMTAHKKTRITVESEQVLIIRRRGSRRRWCWECGREVDAVDVAQAGNPTRAHPLQLRDRAHNEGWHLIETAEGPLLVCVESLLKSSDGPTKA
jgi:hypothetical protein